MSEQEKKSGDNEVHEAKQVDRTEEIASSAAVPKQGYRLLLISVIFMLFILLFNTAGLFLLFYLNRGPAQPPAGPVSGAPKEFLKVLSLSPRGQVSPRHTSIGDILEVIDEPTVVDIGNIELIPEAGVMESASVITVVFNKPIDSECLKNSPLIINPALPGRYSLAKPNTLVFVPDRPFTRATQYSVTVNSLAVKSSAGLKMEASVRSTFSTPPLRVGQISQSSVSQDAVIFYAQFSEAVVPSRFKEHAEVFYRRDNELVAVPFTVTTYGASKRIRFRVDKPEHPNFTIRIKPGLRSVPGPLPLTEITEKEISLQRELLITNLRHSLKYPRESYISIDFNNNVLREVLKDYITIVPEIDFSLKQQYYHNSYRLNAAFQPNTEYTVTLKRGLPSTLFHRLEQDYSKKIKFGNAGKHLEFPSGTGYFSSRTMQKIPVETVNISRLRVSVKRLYPNNIVHALHGNDRHYMSKALGTKIISVEKADNQSVETLLDLAELKKDISKGVFQIRVNSPDYHYGREYTAVISDLGLSARSTAAEILVWTLSLRTARPLAGVKVTVWSYSNQIIGQAASDENGLALIPVTQDDGKPFVLVAEYEDEFTYLPLAGQVDRGDVRKGAPYLTEGYEGFAFCERGMYRPGDEVRLGLLVRDGDFQAPPPMPVELTIIRPGNKEAHKETVVLGPEAAASVTTTISKIMPTGVYRVQWRIPGHKKVLASTTFRLEDYIPNLIKIQVTAPEGRFAAKDGFEFNVKAEYLFGKPAEGREVRAVIKYGPAPFMPEKFKDYVFTKNGNKRYHVEHLKGETDAQGACTLKVPPHILDNPAALGVSGNIEVMEVGGRPVRGHFYRIMDPVPFYLGARSPGRYLESGQESRIDVAAVKPDGSLVTEIIPVEAFLERVSYAHIMRRSGRRARFENVREVDVESRFPLDLEQGLGQLTIKPVHIGQYQLRLVCADGNDALIEFFAHGPGTTTGWAIEHPDRLQLSLDQASYKIGNTARVLIRSPFTGTLLVTVEKDRVLHRQTLEMSANEQIVRIPVEDGFRPNVYICATVVRPVAAEKKWAPHRASGAVRLMVDRSDRILSCEMKMQDTARPGKDWQVDLLLKSGEEPVANSRVLVMAVDEGVLRLTDYQRPEPGKFFYRPRALAIKEHDMFSDLAPLLAAWETEKASKPGGGRFQRMGELARRLNPIDVKRVKTAVLYSGFLDTDAQGLCTAAFSLPNYIGELRIMVLAVKGSSFGNAEASLRVRSPVMLQAVLPRFMAPGDTVSIPVTLFNESGTDGDLALAGTASGPLQIEPGMPASVTVAARGQVTVPVRLKALDRAAKASVDFRVSRGEESYHEKTELAVRPAAGISKKLRVERIPRGQSRVIKAGSSFYPGTARTRVIAGSISLVNLVPHMQRLLRYPYGCVEQTTSKLIPLIYMADIVDLLDPEVFRGVAVADFVKLGIDRLRSMQTHGGGLGYWPGNAQPYYYGSVYAADFLTEARRAGYSIDAGFFKPLLDYIRNGIEGRISEDDFAIASHACYVLAKNGQAPENWMNRLVEVFGNTEDKEKDWHYRNTSGRFYLALAHKIGGSDEEARKVFSAAPFSNLDFPRDMSGYLSSPIRQKAILLMTYLDMDPQSPMVRNLSDSLSKRLRRPTTTQEKAFGIMALGKFVRITESPSTDMKAEIILPDSSKVELGPLASRAFPLKEEESLTIKVISGKQLYINVLEEGVPLDGKITEGAAGLSVSRRWFRAADNAEVIDGRFIQGELYNVILYIQPKAPTRNLIIADLLPAGLEPEKMRPSFAGPEAKKWPLLTTDHVEHRDDRVLGFREAVVNRPMRFAYMVRAVSEGDFVQPPFEVSCMYDPDIFCIQGSGRIKVVKPEPEKAVPEKEKQDAPVPEAVPAN